MIKIIDKRYYRTGAEILLIIAFMVSLGVNVSDKDEGYLPYSCDDPDVDDMLCYKLSRVGVKGVNLYCYYDRDRPQSYKRCNPGWKRILDVDEYNPECPEVMVVSYVTNCETGETDKWFCNGIGESADCKRKQDLLMPFG